jgi:hypothetical protein
VRWLDLQSSESSHSLSMLVALMKPSRPVSASTLAIVLIVRTCFRTHGTIDDRVLVQQPQIKIVENTKVIAELNTHLRRIVRLQGKHSSVDRSIIMRAEHWVTICTQISICVETGNFAPKRWMRLDLPFSDCATSETRLTIIPTTSHRRKGPVTFAQNS